MYVISVKRIRYCTGEQIPEEQQYWEYASYDNYDCSCFDNINRAEDFKTIENAKAWWEEFKRYLTCVYEKDYDFSTIAIRKLVFKKVCEL